MPSIARPSDTSNIPQHDIGYCSGPLHYHCGHTNMNYQKHHFCRFALMTTRTCRKEVHQKAKRDAQVGYLLQKHVIFTQPAGCGQLRAHSHGLETTAGRFSSALASCRICLGLQIAQIRHDLHTSCPKIGLIEVICLEP